VKRRDFFTRDRRGPQGPDDLPRFRNAPGPHIGRGNLPTTLMSKEGQTPNSLPENAPSWTACIKKSSTIFERV
jgi:hypothetical protein